MKKLDGMIEQARKNKADYEKSLEVFTPEYFLANFTYEDKEELLRYRKEVNGLGGYQVYNVVSKAIEELKKQAHPEVDGVKYYKDIIEKLTVELTDEEKLNLDRRLYNQCQPRLIYTTLGRVIPSDRENDVHKELFDLGVIAPMVEVQCEYCGDSIMIDNVRKGQSIRNVLGLDEHAEKEEVEDALYNTLECNNCDGDFYVSEPMIEEAIERINNPTSFYRFKVIAKPDMTIDNI